MNTFVRPSMTMAEIQDIAAQLDDGWEALAPTEMLPVALENKRYGWRLILKVDTRWHCVNLPPSAFIFGVGKTPALAVRSLRRKLAKAVRS